MRRSGVLVVGVALAVALAMPGNSQAGFGDLPLGDDFFDPDFYESGIGGGVFTWQWNDDIQNEHNVRQDTKLFRSGPPTDNPAASYGPIELPAGKYHYYCEVHGTENGGQMDGLLEIMPSADAQVEDYVPITWAFDSEIRVGDSWDVRYRVDGGQWKDWKKGTSKLGGSFGKNDKPVNFNQNRIYKVAVKTELAANPDRHSKFSPAVTFPNN